MTNEVYGGLTKMYVPFLLPVKWDETERVIIDARGDVICDTGRWLHFDRQPLQKMRADFLIKLLNGDLVVLKDFKNGEIIVEDSRKFFGA